MEEEGEHEDNMVRRKRKDPLRKREK